MLPALKTFVAVARCGTFTAAAHEIGMTQSAVSAQIRALETDLGTPLFDRTGRSAILNVAGRNALPLATQIVELYARMALPGDTSAWRGQIRVGAITSAQIGLLPRALKRFRATFPHIDVKLTPGVSLNLLAQIDAGDIDMAVLVRPPMPLPKELRWQTLSRESFVLIVPPDVAGDDPRALLTRQPFVRYYRGSFGGRLVDRFLLAHRLQVSDALELDELEAIVRMVEHGLGVALIPHSPVLDLGSARLRVVPLGDLVFQRELGLLWRGPSARQPVAARLAAMLAEVAQASADRTASGQSG